LQTNSEPTANKEVGAEETEEAADGTHNVGTTKLFLPNRVNTTIVSTENNNQNSTGTVSSTLSSKQSEAFLYLEEDDCQREREVVIGYKLVDKLTEYKESLLSYAWISNNFHKAKYLNDQMLEIGNEKGILKGAFKCIGVTSFPQKNHTIQH
jgi:hypothetical protein